jgi:subtilisin family serine protease/subtilisin-like proprotein convertase family protein
MRPFGRLFQSIRRSHTPRSRAGIHLECLSLESRITPTAKPRLISPVGSTSAVSSSEIVASLRSTSPLRDLANVTNYLGLGSAVDLARSEVIFTDGLTSYVSIGLQPGTNPLTVTAAFAPVTSLFAWVAPNYVYAPSLPGAAGWLELTPNDPLYPQQWHLPAVKAPQAWDVTYGNPAITVAVFDGGIDLNHPDLQNNLFRNPLEIAGDGLDNDGNGYVDDITGWDFSTNTNNTNPIDPLTDTHGTQVAGLLAATIDNALGVAGLAGRVKILPMKIVGSGALTSLSLARAAAYSVQVGAKIITCSINIDPLVGDPSFEATANFVYNRGLLWFNSAGNYNAANPPRQQFEQFLFVSATDRNDRKASYSNYGSGIDVSAPGGDLGDGLITTTTIAAGGYGPAFGTSMAAPLAAATAALVWSAHPGFSRDQVASRILTTAADLDPFNTAYIDMLGSGRIDAGRAVNAATAVTRLGALTGLPSAGVPARGTFGTLTLRLEAPVDPSTVVPGNFELRHAGADNQFGTSDDTIIPLSLTNSQPVRIGTNELYLSASVSYVPGIYKFTAKSGGLRDPFGIPVDGDGDGQAGGDLVRIFGAAISATGTAYEDNDGSGTYSPGEPTLPGETIFVDLDGDGILDGQTGTSSTAIVIPDDANTTVATGILIAGLTLPVERVTATIHLLHAQPGDLRLVLVSPNGTRVVLSDNRFIAPRTNDFAVSLTFDDAAAPADTVNGIVRPAQPLASFRGESGNGVWTLEITDLTPGDSGTLLGWSISVMEEPVAVTDDLGGFSFGDTVPAGQYHILPLVDSGEVPSGDSTIVFVEGQPNPPITVGILQVGAVTGRVTSTFGMPIAGATVFADANANGRPDAGERSAITGPGGYYSLEGLSAGTHTIRIVPPLGTDPFAPAGGSITVTLASAVQGSRQNNFFLSPRPGPALPTLASVTPDPRTSGVASFDIDFNLPFDGLTVNDVRLTRNGLPVSLADATLIGSAGVYHLIGTAAATAAEGVYRLTVTTPAGGTPPSTSTTWTVDLTPPVIQSLTIARIGPGRPVTSATVTFSEPVAGLTLANVVLTRNGTSISLAGATLTGAGAVYTITGLQPPTTPSGQYVLSVHGGAGTVTDAAGNIFSGTTSVSFNVDDTLPPVFQDRIVTVTDFGRTTMMNVSNTAGTVLYALMPFGPSFTGGARVTTADYNDDGIGDVIVGSGTGRIPEVRIYDGRNGILLTSFLAFEAGFTGGINVATADFDGDGRSELIVSPDLGGGPRVRVLSLNGQTTFADFFGIDDPDFRGGARVAAGDLNGDGTPDLIVAAGFGGGPRIAAFDGTTLRTTPTKLFNDFFVFESSLRNGVTLTSFDLDHDGFAELIAGGGPGGGPRVFALSGQALTTTGQQTPVANFFAGSPNSRSGTVLARKDLDGDGEFDLLATDGPTVRGYLTSAILANPGSPTLERQFNPFGFFGGVFVG